LPLEVLGAEQGSCSPSLAAKRSETVNPQTSSFVPQEAATVAATQSAPNQPQLSWLSLLSSEAHARLARNEPAIMATFTRDFERVLLETALHYSRGRRMEAAQRLGIGRNTLTRKCSELGLNEEGGE
jgi:two-component system, NtrC family, nitrogen regulation response regulator GlnG